MSKDAHKVTKANQKRVAEMADSGYTHRKIADYMGFKTVRDLRGHYGDILWEVEKKFLPRIKTAQEHLLNMAENCRNNPTWTIYALKSWAGRYDMPEKQEEEVVKDVQIPKIEVEVLPAKPVGTTASDDASDEVTH